MYLIKKGFLFFRIKYKGDLFMESAIFKIGSLVCYVLFILSWGAIMYMPNLDKTKKISPGTSKLIEIGFCTLGIVDTIGSLLLLIVVVPILFTSIIFAIIGFLEKPMQKVNSNYITGISFILIVIIKIFNF